MTKLNAQRGFTLVELAIVLTIIGLLLGGILKGRQLMQNARITSTIAQVSAIEAATTTFQDTQGALPGDMADATTRIPNCANCNAAAAGENNGKVGPTGWTLRVAQVAGAINPSTTEQGETLLFWAELAQSGLLGGVPYNGDATGAVVPVFGTHAPAARLGGGFVVGNADGATAQFGSPGAITGNMTRLAGTVLFLTPSLTNNPTGAVGQQVMDPAAAAQIDRKFDDGQALTGRAQGSGNGAANGCFVINAANDYLYEEKATGRNCDVFFQING